MSNNNLKAFTKAEQEDLTTVADSIIKKAKTLGATDAEVAIALAEGISADVRMRDIDTVSFHRSKSVDVSVYVGKKKGSASSSDMSEQAIDATVQAACDIAKYTSEDEFSGLADKELLLTKMQDLDLYHPWQISAEDAIELALRCEALGLDMDKRITNSDGVNVSTSQSLGVYANSLDFCESVFSSRHNISSVLIASANDKMQRDYWYSVGRSFEDLQSIATIAKHAVERTVNKLDARKIPTGKFPVIFEASIAASLIGSLVSAISGGSLYRGASFLLNCLDQQIFPEFIEILERPHLKRGLASAMFDAEGVATHDRTLVSNGILKDYVLGSYSARKLGLKSTANAGGIHNLFVNHSNLKFKDLLKTMGTGLLITEVMGQGVNIVNGDYSRGASGYWVENGEVLYPVHEITIASNLKEMFKNIIAISDDLDKRKTITSGSILVDTMIVAG